MSLYNNNVTGVSLRSTLISTFIQSADPDEMASRIQALVAQGGVVADVVAIVLAGGGDGHTFVALVDQTATPLGDSLDAACEVRCYLAATEGELAVARAAALSSLGIITEDYTIIDEQLVGASKGTRFMGLIIALETD